MFDKLLNLEKLSSVRTWLHEHHPFNSTSTWYTFLKRMLAQITDNNTSERAASVSYSLILAVFPTVIFFFTLIPYITFIPDLQGKIMGFFRRVLPGDTYSSVEPPFCDIISRPQGGVLSLGFLSGLIFCHQWPGSHDARL